jgi:hypothetical protein
MNKEDIIERLERIEAKLDAVIKALHEYDDDNIYKGYDEPNEALLKAAGLYNEKVAPCRGHDAASWDEERMDIIGQNGNEGSHYDQKGINELLERYNDPETQKRLIALRDIEKDKFDDYGKRNSDKCVVDKDKSNNTQPKQKQYYKNKHNSNPSRIDGFYKRAENKK